MGVEESVEVSGGEWRGVDGRKRMKLVGSGTEWRVPLGNRIE